MRIVIWTGAAYEPWGKSSASTGGIGGSETAAIHMAQHLATLGNDVFLFGEHDGYEEAFTVSEDLAGEVAVGTVHYVDYRRGMKDPRMLDCDVFVSSRDKRVLRLKPTAGLKILWVHDIHVGDDWENEIQEFDRVYALTKWHKDFLLEIYHQLPREKILVTRNGVDPTRFEPKTPWPELRARKGPRFVWSSSLDRGLDVMLDLWTQIRRLRDDATLEIYYGVDNWKKINAKNPRGLAVIDYFMKRISSMEGDGVHYHGRVGQKELAAAHMGALVWAYPTAWLETSCITAMEAQAAGAFPVTSRLAALPETVQAGFLVPGQNKREAYQTYFLKSLEEILLKPSFTLDALDSLHGRKHFALFGNESAPIDASVDADAVRRANREFVLKERTWDGVARQWIADWASLLEAKKS